MGYKFNEESAKFKGDKMTAIYLADEIGGFAVHLVHEISKIAQRAILRYANVSAAEFAVPVTLCKRKRSEVRTSRPRYAKRSAAEFALPFTYIT